MSSITDTDSTMRRIADLARQAAAGPGVSEPVRTALTEITRLAEPDQGDTLEASDLPMTENQSL